MFSVFTKLADYVAFGLLGLSDQQAFARALHFFIEDTVKIIVLMFVLVFLTGFLRTWLAPEKLKNWLSGKSRFAGYVMAVLLGAITPFCTCSGIPLFLAFLTAGVPLGITMAFLITSPMINEVAAVLFGEAIGWPFTLAYIGTGLSVGLLGGMLADALKLEKWVEPFVFDLQKPQTAVPESGDCCGGKCTSNITLEMTMKDRLRFGLDEAVDIVRRVWLFLLIGVGVGAGIHGYVPQSWFIEHASADNIFAVPLAVVFAVPLYSNCTAVVPVAEVLIAKSVPVGTTLAFLMSTVAISLPEMVILRKVLKLPMLVAFACYLAVAFIIVGYVFNAIF